MRGIQSLKSEMDIVTMGPKMKFIHNAWIWKALIAPIAFYGAFISKAIMQRGCEKSLFFFIYFYFEL